MSADAPPSPANWIADHIKLYQTEPAKAEMWDSALGGARGFIPTLLLITKGRKSGEERFNPLIYSKQGNGFAVIASKGGAPTHPAWYLNLATDPRVELQVGVKHYRANARTAGPEERTRIWADMIKLYPPFDSYQERAGREIPVVVFDPV